MRKARAHYREGVWFALPLSDGGWGVGVVARVTRPASGILGYFFGPRRSQPPSIEDTAGLRPSDAVAVWMVGDLGLQHGEWPILGERDDWNRTEWPVPVYVNHDEITRTARLVYYDDDDIDSVLREEPLAYDVEGYEEDGIYGNVAAQIRLTMLLSEEGERRAARAREGGQMGTWGAGSFDNDEASDWFGDLSGVRDIERLLRRALTEATLVAVGGYLDAETASCAVAAAEIVAALAGRPGENLPVRVREWLAEQTWAPGADIVDSARRSVSRVFDKSELRDLWEEANDPEWESNVTDLRRRLDSLEPSHADGAVCNRPS